MDRIGPDCAALKSGVETEVIADSRGYPRIGARLDGSQDRVKEKGYRYAVAAASACARFGESGERRETSA